MHELLQAALICTMTTCMPPATAAEPTVPDSAAPLQDARKHDPWLGHDKFTHVGASWAATTFTFATARAAGMNTDDALLVAVPVSLALGVAKELADRRGSFFSARDLVADVIGTAAAYFFLREVR